MPAVFYARIANKVYGPFDGEKLKTLVAAGKLTRDDAVSKDGKAGWTPAGNVKGLFPPAELLAAEKPRPIETVIRRERTAVAQPAPRATATIPQAVPAPAAQPTIVYVQAPAAAAPQQVVNTTVVVNAGGKPGNTCATLAAGLGLLSLVAAFVPVLGLIVLPAAGLTLLLALFGFIISLGRGGTGLIGSLGGGLLSLIAIPIALFSTAAGVGGAIQAASEAQRQQASQIGATSAEPSAEAPTEPPAIASDASAQTAPVVPVAATLGAVDAAIPEPAPAEPEQPEPVNPDMRTWTSTAGSKTEAEFQGAIAGKVTLKRADGKVITVPLEKLSPEDQEYLRQRRRKSR